MSRIAVLLLTLSAASVAYAPSETIDVDTGKLGAPPEGWFVPTAGYAAEIVEADRDDGRSALLRATSSSPDAPFGNLMRSIDATPFRGRVVRLRASLHVTSENDTPARGQMWLRVDRPNRTKGFFDNMGDRPVREPRWTDVEIVGRIDDDAEDIALGFMLLGDGALRIDDANLEVLEDALAPEPPRAPSDRGLENLVAFARVFGLVRHFHPSDEAATADWEALAIHGVRAVEEARGARALAEALHEVFAPVAPAVTFDAGPGTPLGAAVETTPDSAERIVAWRHRGFGQTGGLYSSERVDAELEPGLVARLLADVSPEDLPDPLAPLRVELADGVTASIPLAVFADAEHTLPAADTGPPPARPPYVSADDRAVRLAGVVIAWNVFEHFYPYFDVVDADWDAALHEALDAAAADADAVEFLDTLRRLVAELDDGHGSVSHGADPRHARLPLAWELIGEDLVVVDVADGVETIAPGDVVTRIGGRRVDDAIDEARALVSSPTPQLERRGVAYALLRGAFGETVELEVRDGRGRRRRVTLAYGAETATFEHRPDPIADLAPDVVYVDVSRIDDAEFTRVLPALAQARRIVFDFRGYPSTLSAQTLFGPLIREPVQSARWLVPMLSRPHPETLEFDELGRWLLLPNEPYLEAERVFVIDGRAISYAESCLGIVEHYRLGELVGEPTAGTNGNVNPFSLPGGYHISWTGMKVLKHDGSQHHGVGILPTVPVSRTIDGIRAGRDELLEIALEIEVDPPPR